MTDITIGVPVLAKTAELKERYPQCPYPIEAYEELEKQLFDLYIIGWIQVGDVWLDDIEVTVVLLENNEFWVVANDPDDDAKFSPLGPYEDPSEALVVMRLSVNIFEPSRKKNNDQVNESA